MKRSTTTRRSPRRRRSSTGRKAVRSRPRGRRTGTRPPRALVAVVGGAAEVAGATVEGISRTVARAVAGLGGIADSFAQAVSSAAQGTLQAAIAAGGDLAQATRGIAMGVVRGNGRGAGLRPIEQMAESVIHATARLSGDLGQAAKGMVEGTIHAAREIGLDTAEAARAAATGARRAAGEVGGAAVETVRDALAGSMRGMKRARSNPPRSAPAPRRSRQR